MVETISVNNKQNKAMMKYEVINVTPELAQYWMKFNKDNRRISGAVCQNYSRRMEAGEWQLTHQGIAFTGTMARPRKLLDGQHRLAAIIKSGTSQKMSVFWRCNEEVFTVIDGGKQRTFFDHYGWPKDLISMVNVMAYFGMNISKVIKSEADVVATAFKKEFDEIVELTTTRKGITTAAVKCGLAIAMHKNPNEALKMMEFLRGMSKGDLSCCPPAFGQLFEELLATRGSNRTTMMVVIPMVEGMMSPDRWKKRSLFRAGEEYVSDLRKYVHNVCIEAEQSMLKP